MEQLKTVEDLLAVDIELCNKQELSDLLIQLEKAREPLVEEWREQYANPQDPKLPIDTMREGSKKRLNSLDDKIVAVRKGLSFWEAVGEDKE